MMMSTGIVGTIFSIVIIALIILFFVSLFSYVTRKSINSSEQTDRLLEIDKKMDKIIALLEEEKNK